MAQQKAMGQRYPDALAVQVAKAVQVARVALGLRRDLRSQSHVPVCRAPWALQATVAAAAVGAGAVAELALVAQVARVVRVAMAALATTAWS